MTYKLKKGEKPNNCHTCRRQRLRCDGKKPTCQKCISRGVECLGYAAQPLLWVQPKSRTSAAQSQSQPDKSALVVRCGCKKKGRPKLVLMSSAESQEGTSDVEPAAGIAGMPDNNTLNIFLKEMRARGYDVSVLLRHKLPIFRELEPVRYNSYRFVIDTLQYYDNHICCDMVLVDSPDNPYRIPLELWNYLPNLLTDSIVTVSIVHKLARFQSSTAQLTYDAHRKLPFRENHLQHIQHPLLEHVFASQRRQTKSMAEMIADPGMRGNRALLEAAATMMLCDIQQSAFGSWVKHLRGVKALIASRGGFAQLAKEISDELNYELSVVMLVDIMRDAGSPSSMLHLDTEPPQYLEHVETVYRDGAACVFSGPNAILTTLIRTNSARHRLVVDPGLAMTAVAEHASIIRDILAFSAAEWATKQFHTPRLGWKFAEAFFSADYTTEMLQDLTRTFQLAILLYSIRTLFLDQGIHTMPKSAWNVLSMANPDDDQGHVYIGEVEATTVDDLVQTLRRVWALEYKAPAWFGKFTLWPLFVAGMSMDPRTESDEGKDFVCQSLSRICFHMGSFAAIDAVWAIQRTWERAARFERGGWLEDLPQEPLPGLFIA